MAKIFLDANIFIDAIHRKPEKKILDSLEKDIVFLSPLSLHIYSYIFKIKLPNKILSAQKEMFQIVDLSQEILEKSLIGPTNDLEDNIQLHSGAEAECDIFLTEDKKLLDMKFFGKLRINSNQDG